MCGEHMVESVTIMCAPGSSPHVRGARIGGAAGKVQAGIIPACAGSTSAQGYK